MYLKNTRTRKYTIYDFLVNLCIIWKVYVVKLLISFVFKNPGTLKFTICNFLSILTVFTIVKFDDLWLLVDFNNFLIVKIYLFWRFVIFSWFSILEFFLKLADFDDLCLKVYVLLEMVYENSSKND